MHQQLLVTRLCATVMPFLMAAALHANNLAITNVMVRGHDGSRAFIEFDISWENSWRHGTDDDPLYFHDAAWVFFKVQQEGQAAWQHITLEGSGTNPEGYDVGQGTPVELVVPADGVGMFVRRAHDGAGTTAVRRVKAAWNFAAMGFNKSTKVKIQVLGLEMCHVATGVFKVGDGLDTSGELFEGGSSETPQPFAITSAGAIECGDEAGMLWGAVPTTGGVNSMGGAGTIPADFPNGYNAFYCMKYLVTQGQYADFLNLLTREQQAARCSAVTIGNYMSTEDGAMKNRNTVRLVADPGEPAARYYTAEAPDRACNWLSWYHLVAFADWSGLRPMTELEFEKACRGPLEPIPGECAWGSTYIQAQTGHTGADDGSGMEEATPSDANCSCINQIMGPVRVGIFARPGATRQAAGASYWGIMELSGHLAERTISIGNTAGRSFTGNHGDGELATSGSPNVVAWPIGTASGTGFRGGSYTSGRGHVTTSCRASGSYNESGGAAASYSGRLVRTAP